MKYVLLAYRDEKWWKSLSDSERAAFVEACRSSEQDMIDGHQLIDVREPQKEAVLTVQTVDDELLLGDKPVTGNQEQLIQILFIEARDLNAAIQIVSKLPQARAGPIEVRPLKE